MTIAEVGELRGLRVLVVEDSFVIAWSMKQMLGDMGCDVIGPASTVRGALELLHTSACDAAILDVNLLGETSLPVAEELAKRGTPFVFVTGYSSPSVVEVKYRTHPHLRKPLTDLLLKKVMLDNFAGRRSGTHSTEESGSA